MMGFMQPLSRSEQRPEIPSDLFSNLLAVPCATSTISLLPKDCVEFTQITFESAGESEDLRMQNPCGVPNSSISIRGLESGVQLTSFAFAVVAGIG